MSYLVLARRWRPQRFSDLVGQDVVVRTLKNALSSGSLAHAYLLTGIRGVGKTTIARLLAMAVNCEKGSADEPCGECASCTSISRGSNLDVQEMDAASHTGVDDVREILESVRYPSANLKYKVYIIDEAHMLSKSAFNALLKTLEEPPERVMFILATTEVEKLPLTVRSRCQRFDLRRLGFDEISAYLGDVLTREKIEHEAEAVSEIARAADGSVRDALSLTERVLAFAGDKLEATDVRAALGLMGMDQVLMLSDAVFEGDAKSALTCLRSAAGSGYGHRSLLISLAELWHQLACMMVDEKMLDSEPTESVRDWLAQWAERWEAQSLDLRYQVLIAGIRDLSLVDERLGAEMLVMRLSGLQALSSPREIPSKKKLNSHKPAAKPVTEKKSAKAVVEAAPAEASEVQAEPGLPLGDDDQAPAKTFENWEAALKAYVDVRAGVAARLEHVLCLDFGAKVRLALDEHQQKAIAQSDRLAFAEWLGREVHWEPRQDQVGESLSQTKAKQTEHLRQQLWRTAKQNPHINLLISELDAKLVDVRPPGAEDGPVRE